MKSNAARCIANTLIYEGGKTMVRADPGNWTGGKVGVGELRGTNMGIAANTYPNLNIMALSKDQAIAIYQRDYWPKAAGDDMPKGVDQIAFDGVVNSGPGRGVKWVAAALKLPTTTPIRQVAAAATAHPDKVALVKKSIANRLAFLKSLGTWGTFGSGWMKRVVGMEAIGVKMALEERGLTEQAVTTELATVHAPEAQKKAKASAAGAGLSGGTTGTTVGGSAALDPATFDWTAWALIGVVALAALALTWFFVWQWRKNNLRVEAYRAAAAGEIGG